LASHQRNAKVNSWRTTLASQWQHRPRSFPLHPPINAEHGTEQASSTVFQIFWYDPTGNRTEATSFGGARFVHDPRAGQLIWLGEHFKKAAFRGGPYLLIEIEKSLGSSKP